MRCLPLLLSPQAHPPTQAELASIAGSGHDVDLQEAYGKGEAGSSEEDEEEEGGEEGTAADAAQQQEQQAAAGKQGKRRRGGGGPHAAEFGAAEIERRRGLWEQRIGRPEMQVSRGVLGCADADGSSKLLQHGAAVL